MNLIILLLATLKVNLRLCSALLIHFSNEYIEISIFTMVVNNSNSSVKKLRNLNSVLMINAEHQFRTQSVMAGKKSTNVKRSSSKAPVDNMFVRNNPNADNIRNLKRTMVSERTMDPASFKEIINIHKREMMNIFQQKTTSNNSNAQYEKNKWTTFFSLAKKQSRKKKRAISAIKSFEKKENERKILHWLELYNKRHESYDDNFEFSTAVVPPGAWGQVD